MVAREGRSVGIGIDSIVVHVDVLSAIDRPVRGIRDRCRIIGYLRVLADAACGGCSCAAVPCVGRDVLPRVGCIGIIPEGVCGCVVPYTVYADVVGISDVT